MEGLVMSVGAEMRLTMKVSCLWWGSGGEVLRQGVLRSTTARHGSVAW